MRMKHVANGIVLFGLGIGLLAYGSGFFTKIGWLGETHFRLTNYQTNLRLIYALLLVVLGLLLKSVAGKRRWVDVGLCIAAFVTVLLGSGHMLKTVQSGLAARQAAESQQTHGKYIFHSDWVSRHARIWSEHLREFQGRPGINALEIGSFEGRATIWFLERILTHPTASITTIDVFAESYTGYGNFGSYEEVFDKNIEASGFKNKVTKIKGDSKIALRGLPMISFNFVYIDGSHIAKDVLMDAVLVWDLLKPGGVMIFDDYETVGARGEPYGPAYFPKIAIDAFLHVYEPYIELLHKEYLVIVRKREQVDLASQKFGWIAWMRDMLYW